MNSKKKIYMVAALAVVSILALTFWLEPQNAEIQELTTVDETAGTDSDGLDLEFE